MWKVFADTGVAFAGTGSRTVNRGTVAGFDAAAIGAAGKAADGMISPRAPADPPFKSCRLVIIVPTPEGLDGYTLTIDVAQLRVNRETRLHA